MTTSQYANAYLFCDQALDIGNCLFGEQPCQDIFALLGLSVGQKSKRRSIFTRTVV